MAASLRLDINSAEVLATRLSVPLEQLKILSDKTYKYCHKIKGIDKKGKLRIFVEPKGILSFMQKQINKRLFAGLKLPDGIVGSKKKGSPKKNADIHINQRVVGNLDIKDFFPSIKSGRVRDMFFTMGCSDVSAKILTKLTTYKGRVPLGFHTSSYIANLILLNMEKRFKGLCKNHGLRYSFYVDDITVSGSYRVKKLKNLFCRIVKQEGFNVNSDKISFSDNRGRQKVTGLMLNSGKPTVPKAYRKKLRAILYNCVKRGPYSQTTGDVDTFKNSIRSKIGYVSSISPAIGKRLMKDFNKIDWRR